MNAKLLDQMKVKARIRLEKIKAEFKTRMEEGYGDLYDQNNGLAQRVNQRSSIANGNVGQSSGPDQTGGGGQSTPQRNEPSV